MAKQLAEHFNTVWCPEAGRSLIPSSKQFTIEDLKIVATEHAKNILKYTRLSNKLLFIDTDLNITKSYSNFFFNQVPSFEPWVEKANEVDLYIYLASDAPYRDDGTRLPEDTRNELNKSHISFFKDKNNVEYMYWLSRTQGDQEKYNERLSHAIQEIEFFISKY
jgi:HTH-type transcriptional repressor of NAD biosynthesis genes